MSVAWLEPMMWLVDKASRHSKLSNQTFCKEWASTEEVSPLPSQNFLTAYMIILFCLALAFIVLMKVVVSAGNLRRWLSSAGVAVNKIKKTAQEIDRKVFHLCGLLVPLIYQIFLSIGISQTICLQIVWSITCVGTATDLARVYIPFVQRNWPLKSILRESEQTVLCGGTYFSLGCTLSMQFFPPVIAMTSIIFLVLGDMSAALIGRSFGKTVVTMGVGPGGKKSVEGSAAMFLVCIFAGCTIFGQVHLREYAVVVAALVATLVELYEPFGINDNITIPLFSSLSLTLGFMRIYSCEPLSNPILWMM